MIVKRFSAAVGLLLGGCCFCLSQSVYATALAESSIRFAGLQITASDPNGNLELQFNWSLEAFAEARNSLGQSDPDFDSGVSPATAAANAAVAWAGGHGDASALADPPNLNVAANANSQAELPNSVNNAGAASQGRGTLFNTLMITGGAGLVAVDFAGTIDRFLHVLTTDNGLYAETETNFALELLSDLPLVDNQPQDSVVLFFHERLAVGPDSEDRRQGSTPLSGARLLEFNVPYDFVLESDAESFVVVSEPPLLTLMALSLGVFMAFFRRDYLTARRRLLC